MPAPNDAPIACMLTSSALRDRLASIRRLTADELLLHTPGDVELRLLYRARARPAVEAIVQAERECCAFLTFDLDCTVDGVELVIGAPADLDVDARWLFEQFLPESAGSAARASCGCSPGACG